MGEAVTYGLAVAPVWYLGLPISIPMSIGIGFGLADLIPVVGDAFGLTWALDQGRIVVGLGLAVAVYAFGLPFMAVSSLLGITYPSVLPAAARPAGKSGVGPRSAAALSAPVVSDSLLAHNEFIALPPRRPPLRRRRRREPPRRHVQARVQLQRRAVRTPSVRRADPAGPPEASRPVAPE